MHRPGRDRLGDDALVLRRAEELDACRSASWYAHAASGGSASCAAFFVLHFLPELLEEFELELLEEFELELLDEFELELLEEFELELPAATASGPPSARAVCGAAAAGAAATATMMPVAPSFVA